MAFQIGEKVIVKRTDREWNEYHKRAIGRVFKIENRFLMPTKDYRVAYRLKGYNEYNFFEEHLESYDVYKASSKDQYKSLQENFVHNLINPILGEDYYNNGMDVISCDRITTGDILNKYREVRTERDNYKKAFKGTLIVIVVLLFIIFT